MVCQMYIIVFSFSEMVCNNANLICSVKIDYVGFKCPDYWIVGYGMDYNQHYRSLPCIGVLNPKIYDKEKKTEKERKGSSDKK